MMLLIERSGKMIIKTEVNLKNTSQILKVDELEPISLSEYQTDDYVPKDSLQIKTRCFRWAVSYSDWSIWFEV